MSALTKKGHARLEKISFDPYNESAVFQNAIERYKERTGHYPERVFVDQIYRTRANRDYCKFHGIRMSGSKLGRPANDSKASKIERKDNADRIEVERFFSLEKRCNGAGLIVTKLDNTTFVSIGLSFFVTNLFSIPIPNFLFSFFRKIPHFRKYVSLFNLQTNLISLQQHTSYESESNPLMSRH